MVMGTVMITGRGIYSIMVAGPGPESFILIGRGIYSIMVAGTGPESFILIGRGMGMGPESFILIGRGMGMGPESHYVSPKILYEKHSEGGCPPPCASIL